MRKLFATTFGISAMLSLVIGIAFAWTTSITETGEVKYGSLDVALNATPLDNKLYPTGKPISVLQGSLQNNTPDDPGVAVRVDQVNPGTAWNTGVSGAGCSGTITGSIINVSSDYAEPGGNAGGGFEVAFTVGNDAAQVCQGQTLSYAYTINVDTK